MGYATKLGVIPKKTDLIDGLVFNGDTYQNNNYFVIPCFGYKHIEMWAYQNTLVIFLDSAGTELPGTRINFPGCASRDRSDYLTYEIPDDAVKIQFRISGRLAVFEYLHVD